jgi:hypothetical protein
VECGRELPLKAASSICVRCHRVMREDSNYGSDLRED